MLSVQLFTENKSVFCHRLNVDKNGPNLRVYEVIFNNLLYLEIFMFVTKRIEQKCLRLLQFGL